MVGKFEKKKKRLLNDISNQHMDREPVSESTIDLRANSSSQFYHHDLDIHNIQLSSFSPYKLQFVMSFNGT